VFVTVVPARIAKLTADPNATGARAPDPVIVDRVDKVEEEPTAREEAELDARAVVEALCWLDIPATVELAPALDWLPLLEVCPFVPAGSCE
jgi:hypothetical protein